MSAQTLFDFSGRHKTDGLLNADFLPGTGVPAPSDVSVSFDDLTVASLNGKIPNGLNAFSGSGVFAPQGGTSSFTLPDTFNNSDWVVVVSMSQPYAAVGSTVAWAKATGPNTFDAASGCVSTDSTSYAFTYVAVGLVSAPPEPVAESYENYGNYGTGSGSYNVYRRATYTVVNDRLSLGGGKESESIAYISARLKIPLSKLRSAFGSGGYIYFSYEPYYMFIGTHIRLVPNKDVDIGDLTLGNYKLNVVQDNIDFGDLFMENNIQ